MINLNNKILSCRNRIEKYYMIPFTNSLCIKWKSPQEMGGLKMSIYKRFGVEPLINVVGAFTAYGGASMEKEALQAMDEAAKEAVRLDELQAAASKVIA